MKLIEEMKKALPPHVPVQRVKAWADALANSGALVPVPDGDPCEIRNIQEPAIFKYNGGIWRTFCGLGIVKCVSIDGSRYTGLSCYTIVQPVRLVPIAEWEAER